MSGERSPYDILGVRSGAGRAEVNDAYRRLMKRHHPDRPGGNANRAAEINRAYTDLRRRLGEPVRMPVPVPVRRRSRSGRRAAILFLLSAAGFSAVVLIQDARPGSARKTFAVPQFSTPVRAEDGAIYEAPLASLDEPVQSQVVAKAIADAISFHSSGDLAGATAYSNQCHSSLRRERSLGWFDSCTAFDEAMLTLSGGRADDPGAFNESAVIAREVAAARIFPDTLSADSHLHDIRSQVDMAILPMLDSAAAQRP